jgi:regulator of RNase E activity RraB
VSDDWDFYFARIDDAVSSIYLNLGLRADAPVEKQPWLLWVFVEMQSPREDGMSSKEEAPVLHGIEEALTAAINPLCGAQFVGRITGQRRREFYFYGSEPGELDSAVAQAMKAYDSYGFECSSAFQPDWDQYLKLLYPSDTNLQRMFNRRILDALAAHGDDHETERRVDHWLYFPSEEARAAARETLLAIEFTVVDEHLHDEPGDEMPHTLVVSRVDSVDMRTINGITLELARLAAEHGGRYDGWESQATPGKSAAEQTTH